METGCSSETPPKMMPSFNRAMLVPTFQFRAVDESSFNNIAQRAVAADREERGS
jgi:hypothetical protein